MEYLENLIDTYRHYMKYLTGHENKYDYMSGYNEGSLFAFQNVIDDLILLEGYLKNENEEKSK